MLRRHRSVRFQTGHAKAFIQKDFAILIDQNSRAGPVDAGIVGRGHSAQALRPVIDVIGGCLGAACKRERKAGADGR